LRRTPGGLVIGFGMAAANLFCDLLAALAGFAISTDRLLISIGLGNFKDPAG